MLQSVFITLIIMAFVLFILGIERHNVVFSATSILLWLLTMVSQIYVEVPGNGSFDEPSIHPIALGMIIINIIWIIVNWSDISYWKKQP